MIYVIVSSLAALAVILIIKILSATTPNDFEIGGFLDDLAFMQGIRELSKNFRKSERSGHGVPIRNIKNNISAAQKIIERRVHIGENCSEFEIKLYENYHKLLTELGDINSASRSLRALPSCGGIPNVYLLTGYIVNASGGTVTENRFASAIDLYCKDVPLAANEIAMLRCALRLSLLEYISAFSARAVYHEKIRAIAKVDIARGKVNVDYFRYDVYTSQIMNSDRYEIKNKFSSVMEQSGLSASDRISELDAKLAGYSGMVGAAIGTLYSMQNWFDDIFTLALSPTAQFLESAVGSFGQLTEQTKFMYLNFLQRKARRQGVSELIVAKQAVTDSVANGHDIAFEILPQKVSQRACKIMSAFSTIAAATLAIVVGVLYHYAIIAVSILLFFIFLPIIDTIMIDIVVKTRKNFSHPQIKITSKAKKECAIIFCRYIKSVIEYDDAVNNLRTVMSANRGFCYGLLLDAPESVRSELGKKYSKNDGFFLAVRRQAYERKRGAIIQFNDLILHNKTAPFEYVLGEIDSYKYIITLDADSFFFNAEYLIQTMEHPYAQKINVLSLPMKANAYKQDTYFSKFACIGVGNERYTTNTDSGDVVFGCGNYTGKGIYRTSQFAELLSYTLPDNVVLSHDFIEGGIAGCGCAGINGIDEFPHSYSEYHARQIRWFRGDVQLLPLCGKFIKNKFGLKTKSPLSFYYRWRILMNVLEPLASVAAILLVTISAISFLPLLLPAAFSREILGAIKAIRAQRKGARFVTKIILNEAYKLINLPTYAFSVFCAFWLTVVRIIRKKNLLSWTTFAHLQSKRILFVANAVAAIGLIVSAVFSPLKVCFILLAVLFLLALPLDSLLSRKLKEKSVSKSGGKFLAKLADTTWNYFKTMPNFPLPSDNVSDENGWANRTSPTDIAMTLCAVISSLDMEIIDATEAENRIISLLREIDKLQKFDGLPYNWYAASNSVPLKPRYVSSVDSGNLLAALILCKSISTAKPLAEKLIRDMNFSRLYDGRRKLLHIGYNADEKTLDGNYYDLVGSEAVMTYLLCIGCGKLPPESYFALSDRSLKGKKNCLASWTGGMFEYTMPLLFLAPPNGSLLFENVKNVVASHKYYAKKVGNVVWGRSESLYAQRNDCNDYCYSAFGHSEIALSTKRMRNVAAPYAAITALVVDNTEAKNLDAMLNSFVGGLGLPDAIDFDTNKVVDSRMTHHQGMIMSAISIAIGGDSLRVRMRQSSEVRAAELLLCQNADALKSASRKAIAVRYALPAKSEPVAITLRELPQLNYLTNGNYVSVIDENGNGYARCNDVLLSRFDEPHGMQISINGDAVHAGGECVFKSGFAEYRKTENGLFSQVKAFVLPDRNAECRIVIIKNVGNKHKSFLLAASFEPALCGRMADISHKAFSSLFLTVEEGQNYIYANRNGGMPVALFAENGFAFDGCKQHFANGSGARKGNVVFPCLFSSKTVSLAPGEEFSTTFFIVAEESTRKIDDTLRLLTSQGYVSGIIGEVASLAKTFEILPQFGLLGSYLLYKKQKICGKLPTIVVRVTSESKLIFELNQLSRLKFFGVEFIVAVLYKEHYGYKSEIADFVGRAVMAYGERIVSHNEIYAAKDVIADILHEGIDIYAIKNEQLKPPRTTHASKLPLARLPQRMLEYKTGLGGFVSDGYFVDVTGGTPAPWCNVFATEDIGTVVTSNGGGFTFSRNAYQAKLTRWSGDEFADIASEGIVVGESGKIWSATRSPIICDAEYTCEHRIGSSVFFCNYNGIIAKQCEYLSGDAKFFDITLTECACKNRMIDLMFFANLVLGDFIQNTAGGIKFRKSDEMLIAENGALKVFVRCSEKIISHSFYREAFITSGKICRASGLENVGHTPCIAASTRVRLAAGGNVRVVFSMSIGDKPLTLQFANKAQSSSKLPVKILSDEKPIGYYLKWLMAQAYYSRFIARCGFQQVSGAYGFRDQLQDCLALLYYDTELVRKHILRCAAHQFIAGDVMHWWHEPNVGVRTQICDDRLFLPLAVAEYIDFTGDYEILQERANYLKNTKIPEGQHAVYSEMSVSKESATVKAHCILAILSIQLSDRGLVLMGGGDWNDGMDKVGLKGNGESVWCSMFLYYVVKKFMQHLTNEEKKDFVVLQNILSGAVADCFEDDRYVRAFTDDGKVLGSKKSEECKIDLLVQSWAVISGICERENAKKGMQTAYNKLVDKSNGIIKLFDPPFKNMDVGYISDYPRGVRENGGQYTHAAVWFIRAMYELGENERAEELLGMILPTSHTATREDVQRYRQEPYVITADVYSGELGGQGGWSWYTGSAGWLYKTIVEYHYGIKISHGHVSFCPHMKGKASVRIQSQFGKVDISFEIGKYTGDCIVEIDGVTISAQSYSLKSLVGKKVRVIR